MVRSGDDMADDRAASAKQRVVDLHARMAEVQQRLVDLRTHNATHSDADSAELAAEKALTSAVDALRYASRAHVGAAAAHRDAAAILEARGDNVRAQRHRRAASVDDQAAETDRLSADRRPELGRN
jgi:hypothetical protein